MKKTSSMHQPVFIIIDELKSLKNIFLHNIQPHF